MTRPSVPGCGRPDCCTVPAAQLAHAGLGYLPPLLGLVAGAFIGQVLFANDWAAAVLGLSGLAAGARLAGRLSARAIVPISRSSPETLSPTRFAFPRSVNDAAQLDD